MYPLPADELFRQWVLTREAATIPESWSTRSRDGWHIERADDPANAILRPPAGWALCDGQDGRPDLRGRFTP